MHAEFWHERWRENRIGFHEHQPNAQLVRFVDELGLPAGGSVFLPLCGKTLDIGWLLAQGLHVSGVELNELAIRQLFDELGVTPEISELANLKQFRADRLNIYVGDIFALTGHELGNVDAIYDRAALVALPERMRAEYTAHLVDITRSARQLLVSFDYDQSLMAGPPFSVPEAEVLRLYNAHYEMTVLAKEPLVGGLKGRCPATEIVTLLSPR